MVAQYPVRFAYVGVGGYGNAPLLASSKSELIEVAGIFDINGDIAAEQGARYGCRVFDSFEQIVEDESILGLVMTLPPDLNLEHVKMAAAAGKHCYMAKPIAHNLEHARAIKQTCVDAGVILMIGHNDRRRGEVREARRMLDAGRIGQVVLFEGNFSHLGGWSLKPGSWRAQRDRCPTVPLMMLGIHFIDTMIYLVGEAVSVKAFHKHLAMPVDNEDVAVQVYRLASGPLAYIGDTYVTPYSHWMRIMGTTGIIEIQLGKLFLSDRDANRTEVEFPPTSPEVELMEEFARAIAEGVPIETGPDVSIAALACVEGSLKSASDSCEVNLADL